MPKRSLLSAQRGLGVPASPKHRHGDSPVSRTFQSLNTTRPGKRNPGEALNILKALEKSYAREHGKLLDSLLRHLSIRTTREGIQAVKSYGSVHSFFLKDEDDEAAVEKLVEMVCQGLVSAPINPIKAIVNGLLSLRSMTVQQAKPLQMTGAVSKFVRGISGLTALTDLHTSCIMGWWIPQMMEYLACLQVLYEESVEGKQPENRSELLFPIRDILTENTAITVVLLTGFYLTPNAASSKDIGLRESITATCNTLSRVARERGIQASQEQRNALKTRSRHGFPSLATDRNNVVSDEANYKSLFSSLPQLLSSRIMVYLQYIPDSILDRALWQDARRSLGSLSPVQATQSLRQVSSSRNLRVPRINMHSTSGDATRLEETIVPERLRTVVGRLESTALYIGLLRSHWPDSRHELVWAKERAALTRINAILSHELESSYRSISTVPFRIPENWEQWQMFNVLLQTFVKFSRAAVEAGSPSDEVEEVFGHTLVTIRFVTYQLLLAEVMEDNTV